MENLIVARILMLAGFGFTALGVTPDSPDTPEATETVADDPGDASPAAA